MAPKLVKITVTWDDRSHLRVSLQVAWQLITGRYEQATMEFDPARSHPVAYGLRQVLDTRVLPQSFIQLDR